MKKIIFTILFFLFYYDGFAQGTIVASQDSIDFATLSYNSGTTIISLVLSNVGLSPVDISSTSFIHYPGIFSVYQNGGSQTIAAETGASTLVLKAVSSFSPTAGTYYDTLVVVNNSSNNPTLRIPVKFTMLADPGIPAPTLNKTTIDFGHVFEGSSTLRDTIVFTGTIFDIAMSNTWFTNGGGFNVFMNEAPPDINLPANTGTIKVGIQFDPSTPGVYYNSLVVEFTNLFRFGITAKITVDPTPSSISASPTPVDFGAVTSGSGNVTGYVTLSNSGDTPINITSTHFLHTPSIFSVTQNGAPPTQVLDAYKPPARIGQNNIKIKPVNSTAKVKLTDLTLELTAGTNVAPGQYDDTLVVISDANNEPTLYIPVTIIIAAGLIYSDSTSVNFGSIDAYTGNLISYVTLSNSGDAPINISSTNFMHHSDIFSVTQNGGQQYLDPYTPGKVGQINIKNKAVKSIAKVMASELTLELTARGYETAATYYDTLVITSDAYNKPELKIPVKITVTGQGLISAYPSPVDFGGVSENTGNVTASLVLSNSGPAPVNITSTYFMHHSDMFSVTQNGAPPTQVLDGVPQNKIGQIKLKGKTENSTAKVKLSDLTLELTASSSVTGGTYDDTLVVVSDAYNDPALKIPVTISVLGSPIQTGISATPVSVDFGSIISGTGNLTASVTLSNSANSPINITSTYFMHNTNMFSVTQNGAPPTQVLGAFVPGRVGEINMKKKGQNSIAKVMSSDLTLELTAVCSSPAGDYYDTLVVINDSNNDPILKVPVVVHILLAPPPSSVWGWDKDSINFGHVTEMSGVVRDSIAIQSYITGLEIRETRFTNPQTYFTIFKNAAPPICSLNAAAYDKIGIQFNPTTPGVYSDTLAVRNSLNDTAYFPLRIIVDSMKPTITIDSTRLNYGINGYGEPYKDLTLIIRNTTALNRAAVFSGYSFNPPDTLFKILEPFPFTINQNGQKTLTVRFSPNRIGTMSNALKLFNNSINNPLVVQLSANVDFEIPISIDSSELNYGTIGYGEPYKDLSVVVQNNSEFNKTAVFSGYSFNSADSLFALLENSPFSLNAQEHKRLTIRFYPNRTGLISNSITLINNSDNNPNAGIDLFAKVIGSDISLSQDSINFGNVGLQSTPRDTFFTITNTGKYKLAINSFSDLVPDSTFKVTSTISPSSPFILKTDTTYKMFVRLNPYQLGLKKDSIKISNNSNNSPSKVVQISANILLPSLTVSPLELNFGNTKLDTPSKVLSVFIINSGSNPIVISKKEILNDTISFRFLSGQNGVTLAAGKSDTLRIEFRPRQTGVKNGILKISSNDPLLPQRQINLKGLSSGKAVIFTDKQNINFGDVFAGATKDTTIIIRNDGNLNLSVATKSFTGTDNGMFSFVSGGSPVELVQGAKDTIKIRMTGLFPLGSKSAQLNLSSNDPDKPLYSVNLSAIIKAPTMVRKPEKITFDTTIVGNYKDSLVTISNTGTTDLIISNLVFDGAFSDAFSFDSLSYPLTIKPGGSVFVMVRFKPLKAGLEFTNLVIVSNDPITPELSVILVGTGKMPAPAAIYTSVKTLNFGKVPINTSKDTVFTISNTGAQKLIIDTLSLSGVDKAYFVLSGFSLPVQIDPGNSKNIALRFLPTLQDTSKSYTANIKITSNDSSNRQISINLTGSGKIISQAVINVGLITLNFGKVLINTSKDTAFTISNNGTVKLIVDSLSLIGVDKAYFVLSGFSLPIQLDPGNSQIISFRFLPTLSDTNKIYATDIRIKSNDLSNSIMIVNVTGSGKNESYTINTNTNQINFNSIAVNTSKDTIITITSSSLFNKTIDSLNIIGNDKAYFSIQSTFPITLTQNVKTNIIVRFSPTLADLQKIYSATLRIKTNDSQYPLLQIDLTGKGYQDQSQTSLTVNVNSIDFGKLTLGYSKDTVISLKNTGTMSFPINSIVLLGKDSLSFSFPETTTLPFSLAPLEQKNVKLRFMSGSQGSKNASVKITTGGTFPVSSNVALSGQGVVPQIQVAAALNFGSININNSKDSFLVIKNNGEGILTVTFLRITGSDSSSFFVNKLTEVNIINPAQTDTVYCTFSPKTKGNKSASLIISSTDATAPQLIIALNAVCTAPQISITPTAINFGRIKTGSIKDTLFKIENTGNALLNVSGGTISGTNSDKFTIVSGFTPFSLPASGLRTFTIRFQSSDTGIKAARINFTSDDVDNPTKYIDLTAEPYTEVVAKIVNQTTDTTASLGQTKTINFSLNASVTPSWIRIFYRIGGTTNYDSISIAGTGTTFSYVFSPSLITYRGLDYYIKMNINGSEVTLPETNCCENPLSIKVKITTLEIPTPMLANTYSLLSIPFDFSGKNFYDEVVRNFGNPDPFTWRILVWSETDYSELTDTNRINITAGQGFWAISSIDFDLNFLDVYNTPNNSTFKINLKPGWNIIGDPFLYAVSINNIVYPTGKNVDQVLWKWNGSSYEEETVNLNPFTGYFIMNNEMTPVDLLIKPVFSTLTSIAANKNNQSLLTGEWKIKFVLKEENKIKDAAEFGVISTTLNRCNLIKPPAAPGKSADIRLMNNQKGYTNYYYKTNEKNMVWNVEINNLNKNKKNIISLERTGGLPEGCELIVIDNETGCKVNLNSDCIIIPQGAVKKTYKIVAGEKNYIDQELTTAEIAHYRLFQNYPNPFNPSTNIEYTVSDNSFVSLKVYNQLGQEISTLVNENQSKGKYSIKWNAGNNPSGIYYYKISAGNYSAMKKMMLVK
jgi:hypothetical protein